MGVAEGGAAQSRSRGLGAKSEDFRGDMHERAQCELLVLEAV